MPNTGLPSPASTPQLMLENNYRQTQDWLSKREQELQTQMIPTQGPVPERHRGATDTKQPEFNSEAYAKAIQDLQVEYDTRMDEIEANMNTVRQTQNWIDLGIIDSAMGEKLKWGAVVPKEALDMMFPEPEAGPTRAPFSPTQMGKQGKVIKQFAKAAEEVDVPGFWDQPTHDTMLKQYKTWRTAVGYDAMSFSQQRQLDNEWDTWVGQEKPQAKWNPTAKEVRALRAKGPITRGFSAQFRGTPVGPTEPSNPLQVNIKANLPKQKPTFLEKVGGIGTPGMRGAQPETEPVKLSGKDQEAIAWARQNPEDPRAIKILTLHGAQ